MAALPSTASGGARPAAPRSRPRRSPMARRHSVTPRRRQQRIERRAGGRAASRTRPGAGTGRIRRRLSLAYVMVIRGGPGTLVVARHQPPGRWPRMSIHEKARTTPRGRRVIARHLLEGEAPVGQVAAELHVDGNAVRRGAAVADELARDRPPVRHPDRHHHRHPAPARPNRRRALDPSAPTVRDQPERPGQLPHVDPAISAGSVWSVIGSPVGARAWAETEASARTLGTSKSTMPRALSRPRSCPTSARRARSPSSSAPSPGSLAAASRSSASCPITATATAAGSCATPVPRPAPSVGGRGPARRALPSGPGASSRPSCANAPTRGPRAPRARADALP